MAWQDEQAAFVPLKTAWPRRMSPPESVAGAPRAGPSARPRRRRASRTAPRPRAGPSGRTSPGGASASRPAGPAARAIASGPRRASARPPRRSSARRPRAAGRPRAGPAVSSASASVAELRRRRASPSRARRRRRSAPATGWSGSSCVAEEGERARARPRPARRARPRAPRAGRRPAGLRGAATSSRAAASAAPSPSGSGRARAVGDGLADQRRRRRPPGRATRPSTHAGGTSFRPDRAMARRTISAGVRRGVVVGPRGGRRAGPGSAGARANRASWRSSSARSAGGQASAVEPLAERAGQRVAPFGMAAGDPRGGLPQPRVGRGERGRRRPPASRPPPSIWSRAISAARRVRGFGGSSPAAVAAGSAISIRAIGQRMLQDAVGRLGQARRAAPGTADAVADPPERLGRGAAVLRRTAFASISISAGTASRSRQRLAEWIAAWRTVSSGSAERVADDGAGVRRGRSASRPRRRCAGPRATGPSRTTSASSGHRRSPPGRGQGLDRPPPDGRPRVVEQRDELVRQGAESILQSSFSPRGSSTAGRPLAADAVDRRRARRA